MKQKFNFKRKKTNKAKKVLLGIGVGFLALAAAAGTAWALNNHYDWVELPEWLTPETSEPVTSEEPSEPDHSVLVFSREQIIASFIINDTVSFEDVELANFSLSPSVLGTQIKIDNETISFQFPVQPSTTVSMYATSVALGDTSISYTTFENGFIYDFSDFTVVTAEALVPVVTAIA